MSGRQHPVQPGWNWGCMGFIVAAIIFWVVVALLIAHFV